MADLELLSRVPLFAGLAPGDLTDLSYALRRRQYDRGHTLFVEGEPGSYLFIVETGQIKLALSSTEGREVIIDLFGPGDFFGELALLDGEDRSADAIAVEPSTLQLLAREDFLRFVRERPHFAEHLLVVLTRRLRRDALLIADAAFLDVPARLARTVLRLACRTTGGANSLMTTPRLSQTDLAGLAGTTRETLNKWLGEFEHQGLIERDKGRIVVLRADALRKRIY